MNSKIGFTSKVAVGSLALVGGIGQLGPDRAEATTTLSGVANFQESTTTTNSTYHTTNTNPGTQSFPYILSKEYFTSSGEYDFRPFIKIKTSSVTLGPGEVVSGAELGLYFTDSAYFGGTAGRAEYIDLWSVADEFVPASVTMTHYDGTNAWTDGFAAGIDGFARTPAERHLAQLWANGTQPVGTPLNQVNDDVQQYKLFKGDALDAYLNAQIAAGEDAYLALTNSNGSGHGVRFVASSDVSWGGFLDNRPYLTITTEVPEPAAGVVLLVMGTLAASGRRKRRAQ